MGSRRQPPRADRRGAYRPVLQMLTVLLAAGVITAACLPLKTAPRSNQVVTPPPVEQPAPQPVQPEPVKPVPSEPTPPAPTPTPEPSTPLPSLPDGDPSKLIVNGSRQCKMIALTYDAGSGADGATAILDTLKKHGITSTFFLTGQWVEKYPDLAKRIAAEGHEIANHTYSHPDLTQLPQDQVIKQIKDGEAAIRKVTGRETKPLFREPYGAFNDVERRLVHKAGFSYSIYWDVDTLDWQFHGVDSTVKRIMDKSQGGSIVLMHLNVPDSAKASDKVIPALQAKGYKLTTVSHLLNCN